MRSWHRLIEMFIQLGSPQFTNRDQSIHCNGLQQIRQLTFEFQFNRRSDGMVAESKEFQDEPLITSSQHPRRPRSATPMAAYESVTQNR